MADNFLINSGKIEREALYDKEQISSGSHETSGELSKVQEIVHGNEVVEFAEGNVSEDIGEGKNKASSGSLKSTGSQTQAASDLKKIVIPSLEIMRTQVSVQLKKEIYILEKEAFHIAKSRTKFSSYQLTVSVARIRELKDILANLAYVTVETLKNWWMRFVKEV